MKNEENYLKVGTKVTLSSNSIWHGCGFGNNPTGITGVVVLNELDSMRFPMLPIKVLWSDGTQNSYDREDLKVLGEGYNFGELYQRVGPMVFPLGKVGEYSGKSLKGTTEPLYIGDILRVVSKMTGADTQCVLCKDEKGTFVFGWESSTRNGNWNPDLEVSKYEAFSDVKFNESWGAKYEPRWCKNLVDGEPTW